MFSLKPLTKNAPSHKVSAAAGRLAITSCVFLLVGCSVDDGSNVKVNSKDPEAVLSWVAKYHGRNNTGMTFKNGRLFLQHEDRFLINPVFSGGDMVYRLLAAFKKSADDPSVIRKIEITFRTEMADKYNNPLGYLPVLTLEFDSTEAWKYNLENSNGFDMVDTSKITYLHPVAAAEVRKYCADSGKYSRDFCARIR